MEERLNYQSSHNSLNGLGMRCIICGRTEGILSFGICGICIGQKYIEKENKDYIVEGGRLR